MGLLDTLIPPPRPRTQAAIPPSDTLTTLDAFFGAQTNAGEFVTYERALTLTAVFASIRILSDAVAAMTLETYEETNAGRSPARALPVYQLLRDDPNPEMTAADCWGTITAHLNLDGNGFLGKQFAGRPGREFVESLWPIRPDRVRVARNRGRLVYYVRDEFGVETVYTAADIIHIRGLTIDGIRGLSPISMAREAIGAGLAIDTFSHRYWQQGAMPSAVLESDKEIEPKNADRLAKRAQRLYGGARNRGRIVVLEDGLKWHQVSLSSVDAGFLDQYRVGVEQVARIFRVPLSKLQAVDSGSSITYRNLEMDQLQFYTDSVMPWAIRIEQALRRDPDLFPTTRYGTEFSPDVLLRADAKTRAQVNQIALGSKPWKRPSEVRRTDGLGPDTDLDEFQLKDPSPPAPTGDQSSPDANAGDPPMGR